MGTVSRIAQNVKIEYEQLSAGELAAFDAENFSSEEAMSEEDWHEALSDGHVYTWTARTQQGQLAAVCVLKCVNGIPFWYCYSIATAPQFRGEGLGGKLYRAAIAGSVSFGKIQAHCAVDNLASIHLHRSLGFQAIQYVPDFYADFKDAILWERQR